MPEKKTLEKAKRDLKQGKSPTTAAGEFVKEEIEHVRHGKHGARSTKQAIAIGLSKARRSGVPLPPPREGATSERTRRSGVPLPPPREGTTSERTRRSAARAYEAGQGKKPARAGSPKRRKATSRA